MPKNMEFLKIKKLPWKKEERVIRKRRIWECYETQMLEPLAGLKSEGEIISLKEGEIISLKEKAKYIL